MRRTAWRFSRQQAKGPASRPSLSTRVIAECLATQQRSPSLFDVAALLAHAPPRIHQGERQHGPEQVGHGMLLEFPVGIKTRAGSSCSADGEGRELLILVPGTMRQGGKQFLLNRFMTERKASEPQNRVWNNFRPREFFRTRGLFHGRHLELCNGLRPDRSSCGTDLRDLSQPSSPQFAAAQQVWHGILARLNEQVGDRRRGDC